MRSIVQCKSQCACIVQQQTIVIQVWLKCDREFETHAHRTVQLACRSLRVTNVNARRPHVSEVTCRVYGVNTHFKIRIIVD
jgi:hypothetical protein